MPFLGRRHFRKFKALSEKTTVEIKENGLFFTRKNGEGLVPWDEISKWKETRDLVLLYPAPRLYYLVPGHFFNKTEEFNKFKNILREKIGKAT